MRLLDASDLACVQRGSGLGVVVATGGDAAFGAIAAGLAIDQTQTAFQRGLQGFSFLLVRVAAVLTTSIFVINVSAGR